jgi:hypothetical protein
MGSFSTVSEVSITVHVLYGEEKYLKVAGRIVCYNNFF